MFSWLTGANQSIVENNENTIRRKYVFSGRVQGVGFRYQASRRATELGLIGWVKNELDGTVQMEVQGSPERIEQLLFSLQDDRYIWIDSLESEEIPCKSGEKRFIIG